MDFAETGGMAWAERKPTEALCVSAALSDQAAFKRPSDSHVLVTKLWSCKAWQGASK